MSETMSANAENDGRSWSHLRIAAWSAAAVLLMVPLIAMQFTDEVNWNLFDFVIAGALILGVGIAFEFAIRHSSKTAYKIGAGVALLAVFLLIMINGAVGIIGNEGNTANLMYGGVLAVGVIGIIIARFEPLGMARAMVAAAIAQALVAVIAVFAGLGSTGPIWPWDIVGATGVFVTLWLGSALLFRRAANSEVASVRGEVKG